MYQLMRSSPILWNKKNIPTSLMNSELFWRLEREVRLSEDTIQEGKVVEVEVNRPILIPERPSVRYVYLRLQSFGADISFQIDRSNLYLYGFRQNNRPNTPLWQVRGLEEYRQVVGPTSLLPYTSHCPSLTSNAVCLDECPFGFRAFRRAIIALDSMPDPRLRASKSAQHLMVIIITICEATRLLPIEREIANAMTIINENDDDENQNDVYLSADSCTKIHHWAQAHTREKAKHCGILKLKITRR